MVWMTPCPKCPWSSSMCHTGQCHRDSVTTLWIHISEPLHSFLVWPSIPQKNTVPDSHYSWDNCQSQIASPSKRCLESPCMPLMDLPPYPFSTSLLHLFLHSQVHLFGEVLLGYLHDLSPWFSCTTAGETEETFIYSVWNLAWIANENQFALTHQTLSCLRRRTGRWDSNILSFFAQLPRTAL